MRSSAATRPSTASRLAGSRGSSRGISESVNAGRLSTSGTPWRSKRMPRGAAIGRMRIWFLSEASRKRPPSSTWRYQSCPTMMTNTAVTTTAIAMTRRSTASRRPGIPRWPKTGFTSAASRFAGAQGLEAREGRDERGTQEAVVERLREHDVEHHVTERRREAEDLQQRESDDPLGDREEHEPGHLHERLGHREPGPRRPDREADHGLRQRLNTDQPAPRRVLEQPRSEAGHAPELGPPREQFALTRRDEHVPDLDPGSVARHVLEAERAARVALDDARRARPHEVGADRRGGVGENLDDRGAEPHVHDPPDQPVRGNHGR